MSIQTCLCALMVGAFIPAAMADTITLPGGQVEVLPVQASSITPAPALS